MTRTEARASGLKHYDDSPICKRGHTPTLRYVSDASCYHCKMDSSLLWHQSNPDKVLAKSAAYRSRNPTKVSAWRTAWVAKNPDRAREIDAAYRARNPDKVRKIGLLAEAAYRSGNQEKIRAKGNQRRAARWGSQGRHTAEDLIFLMETQRGKCPMCKASIKKKYHVDHIIPLAKGGNDNRQNIQLLCVSCNLKKGAKHPIEFAQLNGMLL